VGEGPLRTQAQQELRAADMRELAWLPGARDDIPQLMRGFDVFVLPSLAEGISNTILEAMASGLPVVATNVGGNPELVAQNKTGMLVPSANVQALAMTLERYVHDPGFAARHGRAGRARVAHEFSMESMVRGYEAVYDELLQLPSMVSARSDQTHVRNCRDL
jgi:glycosyltransferase involved in cell wall biosynthesis